MRPLAIVLAVLVVAAPPAVPQQAVDTTLTLQGFLQQDNDVGVWTIVVPLPLAVLGTQTYVVPVVGKPQRWSRFVNRYVEATGRVTSLPERGTPPIGMEIDHQAPGPGHGRRLAAGRGAQIGGAVTRQGGDEGGHRLGR